MNLTRDWTDGDLARLGIIADELGASRRDMLAVMMSESGMFPWAYNPTPPTAHGIIQFIPSILRNLGWVGTPAQFRALPVIGQLPYVRRYYGPHKGKLGSVTGLYMCTFTPAFMDHANDPDWVIASKDVRGAIFNANAVFDKGGNNDLKIQVRELGLAVERACRGPRWTEMMGRIGETKPAEPLLFDLRTVRGIQQALDLLGYEPGPIDGQRGPRTVHAIKEFQRSAGLIPDGVVGPLTSAALAAKITPPPLAA